MISRLSLFQAYDYYHRAAAQIDLTTEERTFLTYCEENHLEICSEDTAEEIVEAGSKLYDEIP